MPRKTRTELEVENAELRDRLESIYGEVADYFDDDDDDQDDEGDEEGEA